MSDAPPLRMTVPPGDYDCYCDLVDSDGNPVRLGGRLHLQAEQQPLLLLHGDVPMVAEIVNGSYRVGGPQISRRDTLRVDLATGLTAVLLNCVLTLWPGQAIVDAAATLIGRGLGEAVTDQVLFTGLRMQITGSDAVITPPPLQESTSPIDRPAEQPNAWSATERLPREIVSSDETARISCGWDCSFSAMNGYEHRVAFSSVIEVTLQQPLQLPQLFEEWVTPVHRLIGLATGRNEKITYVELRPAGAAQGAEPHTCNYSAAGSPSSLTPPTTTRSARPGSRSGATGRTLRPCSTYAAGGRTLSRHNTR
jgi:hypothetical protein